MKIVPIIEQLFELYFFSYKLFALLKNDYAGDSVHFIRSLHIFLTTLTMLVHNQPQEQ